MKSQPIKNNKIKPKVKPKSTKPSSHRQSNHKQKYGTSKLEADFAHDFLDKLGVKYIYEYEAKDIKRFYDFAVLMYDEIPYITENKHGVECVKQEGQNTVISFLIEIDGGYW